MPYWGCYVLVLLISGCSKPPDLITPCPDYGKRCAQQLINNLGSAS